jgi:hypothetical protein
LAEIAADQLSALLEEFYRRHPQLRRRAKVAWYFDEIQLVAGWERFVRRVLDSENVQVLVSGSSARMLSREVHTSLRGRGIETTVRPFGFREFLRHRGEEPRAEPRRWTADERSRVEKRFGEYLIEGGFPEAQGLTRALRVELLQGYVDTVLFRDVLERYGVSQVSALRWIVRHCLRNPAGTSTPAAVPTPGTRWKRRSSMSCSAGAPTRPMSRPQRASKWISSPPTATAGASCCRSARILRPRTRASVNFGRWPMLRGPNQSCRRRCWS